MKKHLILIFSLIIFFSCSSKSDKDLLSEIKKHSEKKEYNLIIEKVNELREKYPDSEITLEAMEILGNIYSNNLIEPKDELQNSKKAIELFLEINKQFDKVKKGRHYLFMAAFLTSDKLKDFKKAEELYNSFINKYPDDELVSSARDEIKNLGKTPEEIISSFDSKK